MNCENKLLYFHNSEVVENHIKPHLLVPVIYCTGNLYILHSVCVCICVCVIVQYSMVF